MRKLKNHNTCEEQPIFLSDIWVVIPEADCYNQHHEEARLIGAKEFILVNLCQRLQAVEHEHNYNNLYFWPDLIRIMLFLDRPNEHCS